MEEKERTMDEDLEKIIETQKAGVDLETAAHYCGVPFSDILKLIEAGEEESKRISEGKEPRELYVIPLQFYEGSMQAKAEATTRLLANINRAAATDWKASVWLLSKMNKKYSEE